MPTVRKPKASPRSSSPAAPKPRAEKKARAAKSAALPTSAARAALDRATTEIKRLQKDSARNAWAIGRRLAQVAELQLHRARGFENLVDYSDKVLGLGAGTAFQFMRIAKAFSEEVAATFGTEKLDRALAYIAHTPEDEEPSDIPKLKIRIPGDGDAAAVEKPFAEVTVAELRRAVQGASPEPKNPKKKRTADLPGLAAGALDRAERALDKAVGRAAARTATVTARPDGDQVLIEVRGIPLAKASAAFKALASALK